MVRAHFARLGANLGAESPSVSVLLQSNTLEQR